MQELQSSTLLQQELQEEEQDGQDSNMEWFRVLECAGVTDVSHAAPGVTGGGAGWPRLQYGVVQGA